MPVQKAKTKKESTEKPSETTDPKVSEFGLTTDQTTKLLAQIESEYWLAWWFIKPRWDDWALRLKLYNNQRRDIDAVGDPLIFTTHQTVLASLYDDKLAAKWEPREAGDDEVAENLNQLAEYDAELMNKDQLDFEWDWDALFFGYGLMLFMEFNREKMIPIPEIIDPMTWLRDPRGISINGDLKNRGRMKFCGREIRLSKWEMKESGQYKNYENLQIDQTDVKSLLDENERQRQLAMGYSNIQQFKELQGDNATSRLLEWFTYFDGKLRFVTLGNGRKEIVRFETLKKNSIPIIARKIYPTAGEFDGSSIPDMVEDKQRGRARMLNAGLKLVEIGLNSKYIYDQTRITNKHDLDDEQNKYVGVDGNPNNAITIAPKEHVPSDVSYIMGLLDAGAQRATATPELAQGIVSEQKQTATEINVVSQKVTTRYSLSVKVFGWSEKEFWQQWYSLYKEHFKDGIDKKVVRISGVLGASWRPFTRENIVAKVDPDVAIKSKVLSDAERFNRANLFKSYMGVLQTDPNSNMRGAEKHFGSLLGLKKQEIDYFLPPTVEEIRAQDENKRLEKNEKIEVLATDDDWVHIEEHNKVQDNPQKIAHINAHRRAILLKQKRPDLFGGVVPPSAMNPNQGVQNDETGKAVARPVADNNAPTTTPSAPVR